MTEMSTPSVVWRFFRIPDKDNEDAASPTKSFGYTRSIRMPEEPKRVWTVMNPETQVWADFQPVHLVNAFLEDHTHDWTWKNGWFSYGSRVCGADEEAVIAVQFPSEWIDFQGSALTPEIFADGLRQLVPEAAVDGLVAQLFDVTPPKETP